MQKRHLLYRDDARCLRSLDTNGTSKSSLGRAFFLRFRFHAALSVACACDCVGVVRSDIIQQLLLSSVLLGLAIL